MSETPVHYRAQFSWKVWGNHVRTIFEINTDINSRPGTLQTAPLCWPCRYQSSVKSMACKFIRLNPWLTIILFLAPDFMPLLVLDLHIMHFMSQVLVTAFCALHFTPITTVLHVSMGLPSPLLTASRIQALLLVFAYEMSNCLSLCSVFPCLFYIYTTVLLKSLIWLLKGVG